MKKSHSNLLLILLYSNVALSQQWRCASLDADNKTWIGEHNFQKMAMTKSLELCKKQSSQPNSCIASQMICKSSYGTSSNNLWRCSAQDMMAEVWQGNPTSLREEAAFGAKTFCQSKSMIPDTCYINWFSCINMIKGS